MSIEAMIKGMASNARDAARRLRSIERGMKDAALELMAAKVMEKEENIKKENEKDLLLARKKGLSSAMIDRLTLDNKTIRSMADGLIEVAALPDPVGEVTGMWKRPNGLIVVECGYLLVSLALFMNPGPM